MSKFDALHLEVDKPARMTVMLPGMPQPLCDTAGEPAWIDLLSHDSIAAQQFDDRQAEMMLQKRQASPGYIPPPIEARRQLVERAAALTVGWRLLGLDGSALDVAFSREAAIELYGDHRMQWLFDQVVTHLHRRQNFMPAKSSASSPSPNTSSA